MGAGGPAGTAWLTQEGKGRVASAGWTCVEFPLLSPHRAFSQAHTRQVVWGAHKAACPVAHTVSVEEPARPANPHGHVGDEETGPERRRCCLQATQPLTSWT